jgi:hypothetical protein
VFTQLFRLFLPVIGCVTKHSHTRSAYVKTCVLKMWKSKRLYQELLKAVWWMNKTYTRQNCYQDISTQAEIALQ